MTKTQCPLVLFHQMFSSMKISITRLCIPKYLKEILLEIEYDEQSLSHLADYYRIQCADNPSTASRKTTSNTRLFGGIPRRILFIQCSIVLYVH